nr:unnamed protein product [Digitaria exilis]
MALGKNSRILVVGATGYLGRHVVTASARLGHPTFALVRDTAPSDAAKAALLKSFHDAGVTLLKGDVDDHTSMVSAIKLVDVVISTLGVPHRFIPSEFGLDADRSEAMEPIRSMITATKAAIRRAVEAVGVPYTYVLTGYFFGYGLPSIGQVLAKAPPVDDEAFVVLGDGETKVSFADEADTATYTVLAAGDPRAENKTLNIKPTANTLSTSSWRCGRRRPARRSGGCTSPRTTSSGRSKT